ncbi:MAG: transposase [Selenomonadaceae bacterium]|nr:transposase [Selenomonadaceae bacterium]
MKTFCFKLYKSEHNAKLHKQIDAAGLTYNHCIALHNRYYKLFGKFLNQNKLKKHLTKLKKLSKFGYLSEYGSQAVQDVAERIHRAFELFFGNVKRKVRCSPPKFKKVRRYKSFTLKQTAGWKLDEDNHTITINGHSYKYFQSRRIKGKVKTVTIKRDSLGDIYVFLVTDAKIFEVETRTGQRVGFDFGLKTFLTAPDGCDITSPLFFEKNSKLIVKASRELSRKRKGSNNRQRARLKLARFHKKAANQRHDFHFKLARKLCLEYDTICIEDLNVAAIKKLYGKKISDSAFSDFVRILKYAASKFGTLIVEVGRYFASSQLCSECGEKNPQVKDLKIREWICRKCGAHHDRDRNAAINILLEGLGQRPIQETKSDFAFIRSFGC